MHLEALLYLMKSGCQWRLLPKCYPNWKTVYSAYRRWCSKGIWKELFEAVIKYLRPSGTLRCMDASFCKVHADGQGGRKDGPDRLIGRTKGGMNTKLHATVDARKRPVKLHLTTGTCADVIAAEHVLPDEEKAVVLADKGYDSDALRFLIELNGHSHCIPGRRNRKVKIHYDKRQYRKRHRVENFFANLKRSRRIAMRYEKRADHFMGLIYLASTLLWIRSEF